MSNFMDKFKYFIGIDDYEEENPIEDEEDEELDFPATTKTKKFNNKVVNIHTNSNMKIAVHEPLSYEEAPNIVDSKL